MFFKNICLLFVLSLNFFALQAKAQEFTFTKDFGFIMYPKNQNAYCSNEFKASMRNLKSIDSDAIFGFLMILHQDNLESHDIKRGWNTVSDPCLKEGIEYVQGIGLRHGITVRVDTHAGWRRYIKPKRENLNAWFDDMAFYERHYACNFASVYGARYFSLGTEMKNTLVTVGGEGSAFTHTGRPENASGLGRTRWPDIFDQVKSCYSGPVTFSFQHIDDANNSALGNPNELLSKVDFVGLSAYHGVYSATKQSRVLEWQIYHDDVLKPNMNGKQFAFMEYGNRPCSHTLGKPWLANSDECEDNPDAQKNAWDAAMTFCQQTWQCKGMPGGWAWEECSTPFCDSRNNYAVWGHPAEDMMRSYLGGSSLVSDQNMQVSQVSVPNQQSGGLPAKSQNPMFYYCPADKQSTGNGWSNFLHDGVRYDCIFQGSASDNPYGDPARGHQASSNSDPLGLSTQTYPNDGHLYGTSPEGWAYCPRESLPHGTWDNLIHHNGPDLGCFRSEKALPRGGVNVSQTPVTTRECRATVDSFTNGGWGWNGVRGCTPITNWKVL